MEDSIALGNPPEIKRGEEFTDVVFPCAVWSSIFALWATKDIWSTMIGLTGEEDPNDTEDIEAAIQYIAETVAACMRGAHGQHRDIIIALAAELGTTQAALLTINMNHQSLSGTNDDALSAVVRRLSELLDIEGTQDIIHEVAAQRIRYFPYNHWVVSGQVDVTGTQLARGVRRIPSNPSFPFRYQPRLLMPDRPDRPPPRDFQMEEARAFRRATRGMTLQQFERFMSSRDGFNPR